MSRKFIIPSLKVEKNNAVNPRKSALLGLVFSSAILIALLIGGFFLNNQGLSTNFSERNLPPDWQHPFGTDWLGRNMFSRTLKGLRLSFWVGLLSAFISVIIATGLSLLSVYHKKADAVVVWLIDLFLSVPHLVFLILISFALGGGLKGVVIGVAFTHWPSLTRILRAEVLQINQMNYIQVSRKFGKSVWWIGRHHFLPHLLPQMLVGFVLLFPHAILHEAAITFLGFGLSSEQPAIGIILSESMRYLSAGMWWLAFFPGLSLLIVVAVFNRFGKSLKLIWDPFEGQTNA